MAPRMLLKLYRVRPSHSTVNPTSFLTILARDFTLDAELRRVSQCRAPHRFTLDTVFANHGRPTFQTLTPSKKSSIGVPLPRRLYRRKQKNGISCQEKSVEYKLALTTQSAPPGNPCLASEVAACSKSVRVQWLSYW